MVPLRHESFPRHQFDVRLTASGLPLVAPCAGLPRAYIPQISRHSWPTEADGHRVAVTCCSTAASAQQRRTLRCRHACHAGDVRALVATLAPGMRRHVPLLASHSRTTRSNPPLASTWPSEDIPRPQTVSVWPSRVANRRHSFGGAPGGCSSGCVRPADGPTPSRPANAASHRLITVPSAPLLATSRLLGTTPLATEDPRAKGSCSSSACRP